jgi:preprotein translocase subunit SecG
VDRTIRVVLGLLFAILIIVLVLFARGEPGRGGPTGSPTAALVQDGGRT